MEIVYKDGVKRVKLSELKCGDLFAVSNSAIKAIFIKTNSEQGRSVACIRLNDGKVYYTGNEDVVIRVNAKLVVE